MKTSIRKRELISKIYEWLISLGQRIPGARKVWRARRSWGKPQGAGYVSVTKEVWESQYLNGDWIYLKQLEQLARYSVIVGYLQYFKHGCSILDVGCGEGILQEKLSAHGYSKYVGVDISEAAITKALHKKDEKTYFIRADIEDYTPTESFDAIIFNESIYYLNDPLNVLERYVDAALREGGILVISTYAQYERGMCILEGLKAVYTLLDEVNTTHGSKAWVCSVFVPAPRR